MKSAVSDEFWDLRLYVAGRTPKAMAVLATLREACESRLEGRYRITVVDLVKQPRRASADQIVATPTVVRTSPKPARTFIGNLSSVSQLFVGVNMRYAD